MYDPEAHQPYDPEDHQEYDPEDNYQLSYVGYLC